MIIFFLIFDVQLFMIQFTINGHVLLILSFFSNGHTDGVYKRSENPDFVSSRGMVSFNSFCKHHSRPSVFENSNVNGLSLLQSIIKDLHHYLLATCTQVGFNVRY